LHNQKWICNSRQQDIRLIFDLTNSTNDSPYWAATSGVIKAIAPYVLVP